MNHIDRWLRGINSLCNQYESRLVTLREFKAALSKLVSDIDSPLQTVFYQISGEGPFEELEIGQKASEDATNANSLDLGHHFQCKVSLWRKSTLNGKPFDGAAVNEALLDLAKCFWKTQLRDEKTRLISFQFPGTEQIVNNSLSKFLEGSKILSIFFCDLDHFKKVNELHGEAVGDRVILEFAHILDQIVSPDGIVLHRSGDEFIIIYPADAPADSLILARKIMKSVNDYDFKISEIKLSTAAGIAIVENTQDIPPYSELETRAERALKPRQGEKNRGKARLETREGELEYPTLNNPSLELALCVIKSNLATGRPFENPWLNMISRNVHDYIQNVNSSHSQERDLSKLNLQAITDEIAGWIQPQFSDTLMRTALPAEHSGDFSAKFSRLDFVFAVAHAVFRTQLLFSEPQSQGKYLELRYRPDSTCQLRLMPDDILITQIGDDTNNLVTFNLGGFYYYSSLQESRESTNTHQALLIKIGHQPLILPRSIFADIIVVDDRPARGGGLPDFWEATIARLIGSIVANPNINAVYVLGDHQYGALTVAKLEGIEEWRSSADKMSHKTGMPITSIESVADRLKNKIFFPENEGNLVSQLAEILRNSIELRTVTQPLIFPSKRFLRRQLNMEGMLLAKEDGCRVKTIAEAYPVVLEIARSPYEEPLIKDQAGLYLKELIDFKVHLTNPEHDLLPTHFENDKDSFDNYFNNEFVEPNGLFAERLKEKGQLEAVLNHIANIIEDPEKQFATRRAILIVPHEVKEGEDLTPLGLVSIRIISRFVGGQIILSYSFTWRTVEASTGFPYSIYGSVRFSRHLTEEIKKKVPSELSVCIEMGEVSYVAHSLHFFMDVYGQNIARRIVDNASL
jgi:diguanylate cyclase (GGDEF)-like protein